MVLDTPDAELFDATVTRIAGDLRALGDTEALEARRDSRSCDLDHVVEYIPLDEGGPPGLRVSP